MATKVHEIAQDVAITSKGVILTEGKEVTVSDFASEEIFDTLVKAGKIVEVTKAEKKSEEKKSDAKLFEEKAEAKK